MSDRRSSDPLDLFRNLGELPCEEQDVHEMQTRVRDLIRVQELGRAQSTRGRSLGSRWRSRSHFDRRIAAAAVVILALGGVSWFSGLGQLLSNRESARSATLEAPLDESQSTRRLTEMLDRMPLVEELGSTAVGFEVEGAGPLRVSHSVYEIDAGDLDLVMIVGADLDL